MNQQQKQKQLSVLELMENCLASTSLLFDAVLDDAGIVGSERIVYKEMLARHCEANLVAAMWKGLEKKHTEHLAQYMEQSFVISPDKDHIAILMDFTMMYPDLREKLFKAMDVFFDQWVSDVRG